ncbi:AAA family ATPase [Streptomyces sp. BHT-5-2]|uniref:helix-turn-helix transcriptional regulator n=1 Tax=Streptomyces sp. BHT-5-2 TaxID=2866715 RepID=UPI0028C39DD5|nr:AAA family ATPase [Streptomyces sp. BHT-5-2]
MPIAGGGMYLVEREAQLSELAERIGPNTAGRGEFLAVSAPVGCGKSALLQAASARARTQGWKVLAVGGPELEVPAAVDVVGAVRDALRDATATEPPTAPTELAQHLVALASAEPLLLVVDDAHLADPDSTNFLRELGRHLDSAPVHILVSDFRRSAGSHDSRHSVPLYPRSRRRSFTFGPLTRAGVVALVRNRLDRDPAVGLVDELLAVTGGNPLLLQALLDDAVATGAEDRDEPVYGCSFAQTVLTRLRPSNCPALTDVAEAAAVLGPSCTQDRLARVVELAPRDLHHVLDGLTAGGVLSPGRVLHPRVRDVLTGAMDHQATRRLRLRAAEVLYEDGAPAEHIAQHLLAAEAAPQPWAVGILCEAADQAARRYDYQHAIALLKLASDGCTDDLTRVEVHAKLLDITWWVDPTLVSRRLNSLVSSAREGCLSGRWLSRLARRLAWQGRADEADEVFAMARAGRPGDPETRIELAITDFWIRHVFPGMPHATACDGCELNPEMVIGGFPWLPSASELPGLLTGGGQEPVTRRAEEILQRARPDHADLEAAQVALFSLLAAERLDADGLWSIEAAVEAGGTPVPALWTGMLSVAKGVVDLTRGDPAGTVRSVEAALELLDAPKWGIMLGLPRGLHLLAMTEQGRHQEVEKELSRPMPAFYARSPYGLVYLRARGRHHLATGGLRAALDDFRSCGDILRSWKMELPGLVPWRLDLAETLLLLGEREEARVRIDEHLDLFPAPHARSRGIALRLRAMASPMGRRAAGLRESAMVLERCGDPLELARTLGVLTQTYQLTGELNYGRRTLRRAERLARECGGVRALAEIRALAARQTQTPSPGPAVRRPDPAQPAVRTPVAQDKSAAAEAPWAAGGPALTLAEGKVARLAAEGYTNREIAGALYVTASTVEQHLTRIYRKLKIRRRSELGARVNVL